MTEQQIIEWAREADRMSGEKETGSEWIFDFANLIAQHQKEQDARICVEIEKHLGIASECAAAIRSQE